MKTLLKKMIAHDAAHLLNAKKFLFQVYEFNQISSN